jgi:hypothetical protein
MTREEVIESSELKPVKFVSSGHAETCSVPATLLRVDKNDKSLFGTLYNVTDPFTITRLAKYFL